MPATRATLASDLKRNLTRVTNASFNFRKRLPKMKPAMPHLQISEKHFRKSVVSELPQAVFRAERDGQCC